MKRRLPASARASNVVSIRSAKVPKSIRVPDGIDRGTYDTLENLITGLGTAGKDKSVSTTYKFIPIDRGQQEAAFRTDWIARKAIMIPPQDATREWRTWLSDDKDIEAIEDAERGLDLQRKLFTAMWKGRLYGGAGLLLGVNQGKLSEELIPEQVQKDAFEYLHVVTRWDLASGPIDWNISSKYYGQPEYYTRADSSGLTAGDRIHPSRIIRFLGNEIPDLVQAQGWGDTILQVINDAVIAAGTTSAAGAQLLQEIKMDVIKVPDLSASMMNKAYETRLLNRFGVANLAKSLYNILLLDKDEEWNRITANMQHVPETLMVYLMITSGAVDIPATRFLSQSPQGLNATGESDIRNYYDSVKSYQQTDLAPNLDVLDRCLLRSTLGDIKDGDVVYLWRPLWQMTDKEKSEIWKGKADTYKIDLDANQIPPDVLRDARINQLIEDGVYPGLEQILDEYGPLETLEVEEEPVALFGPNGEPLEPDPDAIGIAEVANENNLLPSEKAVGDMAMRIRAALSDRKRAKRKKKGQSRRLYDKRVDTLYVYRKVTNGAKILAHFRKQLDIELLPQRELHVTIMYSRKAVDWTKTGDAWGSNEDGTLTVKAGGMRTMERYNDCLVLLFNNMDLSSRHGSIKYRCEAEWDYDDYTPHITIAEGVPADFDWSKIEPYQGVIELGVEIFEPTKAEDSNREGGPYA